MKPSLIESFVPIVIIILFTVTGIPWKKHVSILVDRGENIERILLDYVDQNTPRDEYQRHLLSFILPSLATVNTDYPDTLNVHFTKDIFSIISNSDYNEMKLSWEVGQIKYKSKQGRWKNLFPLITHNESFTVPITISNGVLPHQDLFLTLLPPKLRKDEDGNKAVVIFPSQNDVIL